jgi:hypothetical protein
MALLAVSLSAGCVDLTTPPPRLEPPDAADQDAAGAQLDASDDAPTVEGDGGTAGDTSADENRADANAPTADRNAPDGSDTDAAGVDRAASDMADAGAPEAPTDAVPAPPSITFTSSSSTVHAPSTGGSAFDSTCGGNRVLIGLSGTSGGMVAGLNSVQGTCGDLKVTGTSSYQITTEANGTLGPFGTASPNAHASSCAPNQMIVGFDGASGAWIDHLFIHCAPLTIQGGPGNYTVAVGTSTKILTRVGPATGTPFAARSCPDGQIAVGILGAAGQAVDRFGLSCRGVEAR